MLILHDVAARLLQSPFVYAVGVSLWSAAKVDYEAFQGWQSQDDALAYDWRIARWRWFQAVMRGVVGYFTGAGLLATLGS